MSATTASTTAETREDIAVENPATGEIAGHVPDMTNDVPTLVARARTAQRDWAARPIRERAEIVAAMRRWLVRNRDRVVESTMRETGKTYEDAVLNEVFVVASALRFWEKKSEGYLKDERVSARSPMVLGRKFVVRRRPLGVVGVIAPWNYPLGTGLVRCRAGAHGRQRGRHQALGRDAAHDQDGGRGLRARGRAAGGRAARGHRPGDTGAALVDHVDMVMFTGSTRTGRKVAARAAERLIPVSLEMGGKDPMIVCADADLDRAANAAATMGLLNSGQICLSIERIYVEDDGARQVRREAA